MIKCGSGVSRVWNLASNAHNGISHKTFFEGSKMAWTASVVFVEPPLAPAGVYQTELPPEGLCVHSESMPVLFGRQCEYEVAIALTCQRRTQLRCLMLHCRLEIAHCGGKFAVSISHSTEL